MVIESHVEQVPVSLKSENDRLLEILSQIRKHVSGQLMLSEDVYLYTYIIKNDWETKIKINFSEWHFQYSPFVHIIQDYSFILNPHETLVVQFIANGKPELLTSPVNIMTWRKPFYEFLGTQELWSGAGIGTTTFYVPPLDSMHIEIKKEIH